MKNGSPHSRHLPFPHMTHIHQRHLPHHLILIVAESVCATIYTILITIIYTNSDGDTCIRSCTTNTPNREIDDTSILQLIMVEWDIWPQKMHSISEHLQGCRDASNLLNLFEQYYAQNIATVLENDRLHNS